MTTTPSAKSDSEPTPVSAHEVACYKDRARVWSSLEAMEKLIGSVVGGPGFLRCQGLVVVDENGFERILLHAWEEGTAELEVKAVGYDGRPNGCNVLISGTSEGVASMAVTEAGNFAQSLNDRGLRDCRDDDAPVEAVADGDRLATLERAVVALVADNAALRVRLDAMAEEVVTRSLRVVDGDGRTHVLADVGVDWGTITITSQDCLDSDTGAEVFLIANGQTLKPVASIAAHLDNEDVATITTLSGAASEPDTAA